MASGLQKPGGYHLDMMVLGCIIYPVVSIFGLPFPCAATVRSLAHLISLTTYEFRPIHGGGMQRVVAKVIEQRWTHFMIHALMLVSLFASGVMKYIPNGALLSCSCSWGSLPFQATSCSTACFCGASSIPAHILVF